MTNITTNKQINNGTKKQTIPQTNKLYNKKTKHNDKQTNNTIKKQTYVLEVHLTNV